MNPIDRSVEARAVRKPDLFLSHSSRDKTFVRKLAHQLSRCGADVWLDEWELRPGDSLHDVIIGAVSRAKFVGVVVGARFSDSSWANDEMKIGLTRERNEKRTLVLPLVVGRQPIPPVLGDKLFLDFRKKHYEGLVRLAALLNKIPPQTTEGAIEATRPTDLASAISTLRYAGFDPPIALPKEDVEIIMAAGGHKDEKGGLFFSPLELLNNPALPPRLSRLMRELVDEVQRDA